MRSLDDRQLEQFVEEGYVRLDRAFSKTLADAARTILWRETGCSPDDPGTWTRPVVRLGDHAEPPFAAAADTPRLREAFDQLVGAGRWAPRRSLGTFPIRFPNAVEPDDAGWHVDASYQGPAGDWRINVFSRERALLMLFLFSDVGADDAPTRIRAGSHRVVARVLEPAGADGLSFMSLAEKLAGTDDLPVVQATGEAGSVYLCHPFLVHAAQRHRGRTPRFLAQPPLYAPKPCELHRQDAAYSPVEVVIRAGLGRRD